MPPRVANCPPDARRARLSLDEVHNVRSPDGDGKSRARQRNEIRESVPAQERIAVHAALANPGAVTWDTYRDVHPGDRLLTRSVVRGGPDAVPTSLDACGVPAGRPAVAPVRIVADLNAVDSERHVGHTRVVGRPSP